MKQFYIGITALVSCLILYSCKKNSFLDAKPSNALLVPKTLSDLQALLDCEDIMNGTPRHNIGGPNPQLLIDGADNYYISDEGYNNFSPFSKHVYIWDPDQAYGGKTSSTDWSFPYRTVFQANVVLDGITKISKTTGNAKEWNNIKGSALFYRAYCFYQLAQAFAPPYDSSSASSKLGIPLRLTGDISEESKRSTLKETYDRIKNDLILSAKLLPEKPLYKTRPSKYAAYALLARTFQTAGDYKMALAYSDSCLRLYNTLINYNTLDTEAAHPFPIFNGEVIFESVINVEPTELYYRKFDRIDSTLYSSYTENDLRKPIFFFAQENGSFSFKGSYDGEVYPFMGIATDEIYLIRAECYARGNNIKAAMSDLNTLLITRWKSGTFVPYTAMDKDDALKQILHERRKELVFRGLRWTDLRRLNKDPRFAKTLIRIVNGKKYTLPPNDLRYTWPIPADVLSFNPGMKQNAR